MDKEENKAASGSSGRVLRIHREIFLRNKAASLVISLAVYALTILLFGDRLQISGNYFVILPVLSISLSFGLIGGIVSGLLALPANLLLFMALGHPEFSPASKLIAELSGIVVGTAFGALSDYFKTIDREIRQRIETENKLRNTLEEKEILLQEIHHRVKNNLGLIKSLVQLQMNRSDNPTFKEECGKLTHRIFSISLIHELLYAQDSPLHVDMGAYIEGIIREMVRGYGDSPIRLLFSREGRMPLLPRSAARPLGMIVSEVIINSIKHAFPGMSDPEISCVTRCDEGRCLVTIQDNGMGEHRENGDTNSLGLKLIESLARQIDGMADFESGSGTMVTIAFPLPPGTILDIPEEGETGG